MNLFLIYDRLGSLKKFRELVQWPSIYRVASPIFTVVLFKLCMCPYCNEEISFFVVFILKSFEFWTFSKLSLLLKSASITFTKEKNPLFARKTAISHSSMTKPVPSWIVHGYSLQYILRITWCTSTIPLRFIIINIFFLKFPPFVVQHLKIHVIYVWIGSAIYWNLWRGPNTPPQVEK